MKVTNLTNKANGLEGEGEDVVMGINEDNHLTLLNSLTNLYSNPILAALREYSANASDAHKESGQTKAFEVDFAHPYEDGYFLRIRDYGKGMTKDQIVSVYSQYGASTKGSSNEAVGGFGLGSKSGLSVSNHLFVTTISNGVEIKTKILRNENNTSIIRILAEQESTKESGTEILLPLTTKQLVELKNHAAAELIGYTTEEIILNGEKLENSVHNTEQFIPIFCGLRIVAYVKRNDMSLMNTFHTGFKATTPTPEEEYLKASFAVVMGGVYYSSLPSMGSVGEKEHLLSLIKNLRRRFTNSSNIILNIPVGSVDLPPHRDSIIDTERTWNSLLGLFEDLARGLDGSVQAYLNERSLSEASKLTASMSNLFTKDSRWDHQGVAYDNFIGRERTNTQPFLLPSKNPYSDAETVRGISPGCFTSLYAKTRAGEYHRSTPFQRMKISVVELILPEEKYESVFEAITLAKKTSTTVKIPAVKGFISRYLSSCLKSQHGIEDFHVVLNCENKDVVPPNLRPAIDVTYTEEEIRKLYRVLFPTQSRKAVQQKHARVTEKKCIYDVVSTEEKVVYFGGKNEYGPDTTLTEGALVIPSQTAGLKKVSNGNYPSSADYAWTRAGLCKLLDSDVSLIALNDTRSPSIFQKTFHTAVPLGEVVMDYYGKLDSERKLAVQHAYSILSGWSMNIDPLFSLCVGKKLDFQNPAIKLMFGEPELVAVANYLWAFKDSYVEGLLEWKKKFVEEMRGKELAETMLLPIQSLLESDYPSFYSGVYFGKTPPNVPSRARVRRKGYRLPYQDMVKFIDRLTAI